MMISQYVLFDLFSLESQNFDVATENDAKAPDSEPEKGEKSKEIDANDAHDDDDVAEALLAKAEKEQAAMAAASSSTQFDVKIGDGMDIAIHGENGKKCIKKSLLFKYCPWQWTCELQR